jgi:hypothetical protein
MLAAHGVLTDRAWDRLVGSTYPRPG